MFPSPYGILSLRVTLRGCVVQAPIDIACVLPVAVKIGCAQ
jgi:hypothetical protein